MVIKRVGPVSCAKIAGVLYAIIGLIVGGIASLIAMVGFAASGSESSGFGAFMGVGSIIFFPILYACFGFVGTLIMAALYNVVAGMVGGVELETQ
ncbi:MAG TPA: hypothetical protein VFB85_19505 [Vicinamibacterales bacterium]|jgi:hypothetical protein|nr:hypothetical protein [Vicinamibacterales bacterium]